MPNELKPCPFCGGEAILCAEHIYCNECIAEMQIEVYVRADVRMGGLPTYEEAKSAMIAAWNRRANDEQAD